MGSFQITQAQNTFACDGKLYYFGNTGGVDMLSYIDDYTTIPVAVDVCVLPTASHNGLGANPVDHYLYYLDGNSLMKLDAVCNATLVCTLPGNSTKGCFDNRGRYWFDAGGLQAMDINTCSVVAGPFSSLPAGTAVDFAFNPYDCHFYVTSTTLTYKIDTLGNTVSTIPGGLPVSGTIGGVALGSDTRYYGMVNNTTSTTLFAVNLTTGLSDTVFVLPTGTASSGGADMASFLCNEVIAVGFADVDSGCPGLTVQFSDSSLGTGNIITWNFDDPSSGPLNTSALSAPVHTFNSPGTYAVTLTVRSNVTTQCVPLGSDSIVIPVFIGAPPLSVTADTSVCLGDSITLTASGNGIIQWSGGVNLSCTFCQVTTAQPQVATTYYVSLTDTLSSCSRLDSVFVHVNTLPAAPVISVLTPFPLCAGEPVTLQASGNGALSWLPHNTIACDTCPVTQVSPLQQTLYTALVTDTLTGCLASADTLITVLPAPLISLSADTVTCLGDSLYLFGSGSGSLAWTPFGALSCSSCSQPGVAPLTDTYYYLTVTDNSNGCTASDSVWVQVNMLPVINVSGPHQICASDSVSISAGGNSGLQYNWTPSASLSCNNCPNPFAFPVVSTDYTVLATDPQTGCSVTDTVAISVLFQPDVNISGDFTLCKGDTLLLMATGAQQYTWNNGLNTSFIQQPIQQSTVFSVTGTDGICSKTVSASITVYETEPPQISDTSVCSGNQITLHVSGSASFDWYHHPDDAQPFFTGSDYTTEVLNDSTTYFVFATENNCRSNYTELHIHLENCETIIPNVISPDNDGENDVFTIQGQQVSAINGNIYNRWGQSVFGWNGNTESWNGQKENGDVAPAGTYYYVASVTFSYGETIQVKGFFQLLR